jgi:transposase
MRTKSTRYNEEFKKNIVTLHQNGKSYSDLHREYGVGFSALSRWCRQYSEVKTDDGEVMTLKQIDQLRRRNAELEEENIILKKAIAIFTPHSKKD